MCQRVIITYTHPSFSVQFFLVCFLLLCSRFLEVNNITHIVNLAADGPDAPETVKNNEFFRDKQEFKYWSINVADQNEGGEALMKALREDGCLAFMNDALENGHRVLCHCHKVGDTHRDAFVQFACALVSRFWRVVVMSLSPAYQLSRACREAQQPAWLISSNTKACLWMTQWTSAKAVVNVSR